MAKKIYQFIGVVAGENILKDGYYPVTKLGIQAPEGTTFTINEGGEIAVGATQIYELDLTGLGGQIYSIVFKETNETSVIVDIIYEGGGS